ncbi:MAG: DNA-binding response regulator [Deltaproteobacteria bacterium]|nr:DNA-binding response regulator [Deltaproteobacteria bacterium]
MRSVNTALLVDDDDAFRTTLQGSLRRRGVRAQTAATVEEGLVLVEDEQVDLIVLDYRMPRGDGLTALSRYRRQCPDAAIIMLTGYGDIPLAVAAVKEGADTLLSKPVDADRLLREAEAIRGRPRAIAYHLPLPQGSYNLDELEREAIKAALKQSGGVVANAAKLLGIDRRTLQRKLKKIV